MHSHGWDVANEALTAKKATDICFRCVNSEIYNLRRNDRHSIRVEARKTSLLTQAPIVACISFTHALVQAPILLLACQSLDSSLRLARRDLGGFSTIRATLKRECMPFGKSSLELCEGKNSELD